MPKLLFCFLAVVASLNPRAVCFPPACTLDEHCADEIHSVYGKCCGGVCTRSGQLSYNKVIGESCTPDGVDGYENCGGECHSSLICSSDDSLCHAKHGYNCPCKINAECLSQVCRPPASIGEQRLCAGVNLPNGQSCASSTECASNFCTLSNQCASIAAGGACSLGSNQPQCDTGLVCRLSVCTPPPAPCAVDQPCCSQSSDCAKSPPGLFCSFASGTGTCTASPPLPGLDQACPQYSCSGNLLCEQSCNTTNSIYGYCTGPLVCQVRYSLPSGHACSSTAQCSGTNPSCDNYRCIGDNTLAVGEDCGDYSSYYSRCMAPANMCQRNTTSSYSRVCKQSRATPAAAPCYQDESIRGLEECVIGYACAYDSFSRTYYSCQPELAIGSPCTNSGSGLQCAGGFTNCASITADQTLSCSCYQSGCCSCIAPRSVADGQPCNSTKQCGETSLCNSTGTCVNVVGQDCLRYYDCGGDSDQYDCSCQRQCVQINAPTPIPESRAPTVAPAPTPGMCDEQVKAWSAVAPPGLATPYYRVYYDNFDSPSSGSTQFVPAVLQLSVENQAILIDLVCCYTCPYSNSKFNSHLSFGYQVDCAARTITKLENTCDDLRATLAFLNCWAAVSSASSLSLGAGVALAMLLW